MRSHSESKLLAISFALAAAGILACAGALLDAFIPRYSFFGCLTWMAVMGSIVIGTLVGYTWICDKCDRLFDSRHDRLLNGSDLEDKDDIVNPQATVRPQPAKPKVGGGARSTHDATRFLPCEPYVLTLRGSVSPNASSMENRPRTWHGQ
jgi:hypothetical protein